MSNWLKARNDRQFREKLLIREKVVDGIRSFFKQQGFHEVETPLLVQHPGTEPYLEVFETELKVAGAGSKRGFLLTSPELAMKKLLSAGFGNIFQICKSFRNQEGLSSFHNPEFTILEWYRTEADYRAIMEDCEQLLLHLHRQIHGAAGGNILTYQGREYDLATPWERISVAEAFAKYGGIDLETMLSEEKLLEAAAKKGYQLTDTHTWEQAYHQLFLNEIEPNLGQAAPTIIYDYPASQAALSKKKADDPRLAERFEFYLAGLELGNAFSELTDAAEQKERMLKELRERKDLGKTEFALDKEFIQALELGLPETGGIAVGVDRLVMLFADASSVSETLLFPIQDVFAFPEEQ